MDNDRISRTVLDTEIVKTFLLKGVTGEGNIDRTSPFLLKEKSCYSHFPHSVFESVCSIFIKFGMNIMSMGH